MRSAPSHMSGVCKGVCAGRCVIFFFFNDTATTEIYTLPYTTLFRSRPAWDRLRRPARRARRQAPGRGPRRRRQVAERAQTRSEEHTSELQSRQYLVCRLLLEKKKAGVAASQTQGGFTDRDVRSALDH